MKKLRNLPITARFIYGNNLFEVSDNVTVEHELTGVLCTNVAFKSDGKWYFHTRKLEVEFLPDLSVYEAEPIIQMKDSLLEIVLDTLLANSENPIRETNCAEILDVAHHFSNLIYKREYNRLWKKYLPDEVK